MRFDGNKLFVSRSISISRRMHRDFAFNRNRNFGFRDIRALFNTFSKESEAKKTTLKMEYNELPKKYEEELLCYQLKPLLLMLRVIGCFPVEISKSGK
jgi:hypothetical protein